jgi:hypothetical protein
MQPDKLLLAHDEINSHSHREMSKEMQLVIGARLWELEVMPNLAVPVVLDRLF